jgi:hypothetical protein
MIGNLFLQIGDFCGFHKVSAMMSSTKNKNEEETFEVMDHNQEGERTSEWVGLDRIRVLQTDKAENIKKTYTQMANLEFESNDCSDICKKMLGTILWSKKYSDKVKALSKLSTKTTLKLVSLCAETENRGSVIFTNNKSVNNRDFELSENINSVFDLSNNDPITIVYLKTIEMIKHEEFKYLLSNNIVKKYDDDNGSYYNIDFKKTPVEFFLGKKKKKNCSGTIKSKEKVYDIREFEIISQLIFISQALEVSPENCNNEGPYTIVHKEHIRNYILEKIIKVINSSSNKGKIDNNNMSSLMLYEPIGLELDFSFDILKNQISDAEQDGIKLRCSEKYNQAKFKLKHMFFKSYYLLQDFPESKYAITVKKIFQHHNISTEDYQEAYNRFIQLGSKYQDIYTEFIKKYSLENNEIHPSGVFYRLDNNERSRFLSIASEFIMGKRDNTDNSFTRFVTFNSMGTLPTTVKEMMKNDWQKKMIMIVEKLNNLKKRGAMTVFVGNLCFEFIHFKSAMEKALLQIEFAIKNSTCQKEIFSKPNNILQTKAEGCLNSLVDIMQTLQSKINPSWNSKYYDKKKKKLVFNSENECTMTYFMLKSFQIFFRLHKEDPNHFSNEQLSKITQDIFSTVIQVLPLIYQNTSSLTSELDTEDYYRDLLLLIIWVCARGKTDEKTNIVQAMIDIFFPGYELPKQYPRTNPHFVSWNNNKYAKLLRERGDNKKVLKKLTENLHPNQPSLKDEVRITYGPDQFFRIKGNKDTTYKEIKKQLKKFCTKFDRHRPMILQLCDDDGFVFAFPGDNVILNNCCRAMLFATANWDCFLDAWARHQASLNNINLDNEVGIQPAFFLEIKQENNKNNNSRIVLSRIADDLFSESEED